MTILNKVAASAVTFAMIGGAMLPVAAHAQKNATAKTMAATAFNGAGTMFPGTVYQNQHQIAGADGTIHVNQPKGGSTPLMLHMQFKGLIPGATYTVYLDKDGTKPVSPHSFGPWQQVGQFTSNAAGNGSYQYQAAAGTIPSGTHTWAVFVNRADKGATVLISDNFTFTQP